MHTQNVTVREYAVSLRRSRPDAAWRVSVADAANGQTHQIEGLDGLLAYFNAELTPVAAPDRQPVAAGPDA